MALVILIWMINLLTGLGIWWAAHEHEPWWALSVFIVHWVLLVLAGSAANKAKRK